MTDVTPSASSARTVGVRRRVQGLHVVEHPPEGDGKNTKPVVVLVHGSLDRASSFSRVVRRLSDLHVVTYDRRGYHHSRTGGASQGGPDPVSGPGADGAFDGHVADLLEVIGERRAVVVGHSFGGDVALAWRSVVWSSRY